jgi:hypothetical protein
MIAPLMVTYHYVKFYVSIIIHLEVININVRNFNLPIGFYSNPHPLWTPQNITLTPANAVFYTSGNRFVRRTGTFGNLIFSLVPSDNRNTRSTCPTSVFTGIGQTLMSRPDILVIDFYALHIRTIHCHHWYKILVLLYKRALFGLQFVHNLFWLKLKWNTRSKLFYWYHLSCFDEVQGHWQT